MGTSARVQGRVIKRPDEWVVNQIDERCRLGCDALGPWACEAIAEHWGHVWEETTGQSRPSPRDALDDFAQSLADEGDLAEEQIVHLCRILWPHSLTLGLRDTGLSEIVERFLWRIRPWIPIWEAFTSWVLHWCDQRGRKQILFLARDMLGPFLIARELKASASSRLELWVAHASRRHDGELSKIIGQNVDHVNPAQVALVDSGCYGTVATHLVDRIQSQDGSAQQIPACVFYFSRNPHIFGFMNYLMSPDLLASGEIDPDKADFVIYAGDLLEAVPKPYRVVDDGSVLNGELTDMLTFILSMATLSEMADHAELRRPWSISAVRRRAGDLCQTYENAAFNRLLRDSLLFTTTAPKKLPEAYGFADLDFRSFPPQDEVFGAVPG